MEEYINKLKDYPAFLEFERDVIKLIDELNSNDGLDDLSDKRAGEEAKLRAKCKKLMYKMLEPFLNFSEKKEPTPEQIEDAKAKFNL